VHKESYKVIRELQEPRVLNGEPVVRGATDALGGGALKKRVYGMIANRSTGAKG